VNPNLATRARIERHAACFPTELPNIGPAWTKDHAWDRLILSFIGTPVTNSPQPSRHPVDKNPQFFEAFTASANAPFN
jgi:hypothetical protein